MADYFTQFSCVFDVGSSDNAAAALTIRDQMAVDLEDETTSPLALPPSSRWTTPHRSG